MSLLAFIFLMCALGLLGLSMLVSAFIENIFIFAAAVIIIIVLYFVVRGVGEFLEKTGNPLVFISGVAIFLFYLCGLLYISETINMDKSNYYLGFIDVDTGVKTLITIALVVGISMLILFIAMYCPIAVQCVLCIGQVVGMVMFCYFLITLCTHSYSDYATNRIMQDETIYEYTVKKETKIYYPSFRSDNRYPSLFPGKWSTEVFEKGDTVYANSGLDSNEYVRVTNGDIAGYVNVSDLSN